MPPTGQQQPTRTLREIVDELDRYPMDAFLFVQEGLAFTVQRVHGEVADEKASRHVSGQTLCEGLREYALQRWGLLARTVLRRWGIVGTLDFGRIVFVLVENQFMLKTEDDTVEDFRDVFDFATAFELEYRIPAQTAQAGSEACS